MKSPTDELERRVVRARNKHVEAAYWEMEARIDPTQTQYPTVSRHQAFVLAIHNMLDKMRDEGLSA